MSLAAAGHAAAADGGSSNDWTVFGQNTHNTRHAAKEHRISPGNVAQLAPKWVFQTGGDVSANPAVKAGAVYVPDWAGNLYKIDAQTGAEVWARQVKDYVGLSSTVVVRTGPAIEGNTLLFGTQQGAYLVAVDARTGDLIWKTQLDGHFTAVITQSPVASGNRVYVGVASSEEGLAAFFPFVYDCCTFRGSVAAVDLQTGAILWKTFTAPPPPSAATPPSERYSGNGVWGSTPVVDLKRKSLYVTTGNNYNVPSTVKDCADSQPSLVAADVCLAPDNYVDAVIALDLDTGAVKWVRRLQGYDAWIVSCIFPPPPGAGAPCPVPTGPDYDFGSGPNLFTVKAGQGQPRDLLGAGQKSGVYWVLDPESGATVWSTQAGPGSTLGGIQWGSATDEERVYVAISNLPGPGSFVAMDAATGQILWQTADPLGWFDTGPVTVANGVVYAGSMDPQGHMYALDASTGAVLWSFASGGSVNGGAVVVDGTVYWGSGYSNLGLGTPNNKIYAFEVD
jgi:polyvinyl alcohol dehydrogenase (cytochrome)